MSIERFKQLHEELGRSQEEYNHNEKERIERAGELLDDMKNIAAESSRVADAAREASVSFERNSLGIWKRIKNMKTHNKVLAVSLIVILIVIWFMCESSMRSSILSLVTCMITIGIKIFWSMRSRNQNIEPSFESVRKKIKKKIKG